MPVALGGINHKVAPVEVREKLAFSSADLAACCRELLDLPEVEEAVVLSTCNRTEIYLHGQAAAGLFSAIENVLGRKYGSPVSLADPYFYRFRDRQAVEQLFRVACSLDSLVVGETQILGQVREAYRVAGENQAAARVLSRLFQQAVRVGKRARSETAISGGAVSVSSAAVDLARKIFGELTGKKAIILGAGETSELTLSLLVDHGVETVLVANRTYRRAVELAETYHGSAVRYDQLSGFLAQVDILISSTSAPGFVLTLEKVGEIIERRRQPIFMIDLAVPRDIDPALARLNQCFLYNLDDLQSVVRQNMEQRQEQVGLVEEIIAAEVADFMRWYGSLDLVPLIRSLHGHMESLRRAELDRALGKLAHLAPGDRETVEKLSARIMKKFLHGPTSRLKHDPRKLAGMEPEEIVRYLFDLDRESAGDKD